MQSFWRVAIKFYHYYAMLVLKSGRALGVTQRLDKGQIRLNARALESDIREGIYIVPCLDSAIMSELHHQC